MKNGTQLVPTWREMTLVERPPDRTGRDENGFFILLRRINLWKSVQVCSIFNSNALLSYQTKKICENPFNLCNPCAILLRF